MVKQVRHWRTHRKGINRGRKFPAGSKVLIKKTAAKFVVWEYNLSDVKEIQIGLFPEEADAIIRKYAFLGPLSAFLRSPLILRNNFHVQGRVKLVLIPKLAKLLNDYKILYRENGQWFEDFESIRGAMWRMNKFERNKYAAWAKRNSYFLDHMIRIFMSHKLYEHYKDNEEGEFKVEVLK